MNNTGRFLMTLLFIIMTALPVMAGNGLNQGRGMHGGMNPLEHMQHSGMGTNMGKPMHGEMHGGMDMGNREHEFMGMEEKEIRAVNVDGYRVIYRLMDMHAQMPGNPEMEGTYHMMVFFTDSEGKPVTEAKVGYLIKGPDGKIQKTMAMNMGKGFGANVKLTVKGEYEITAKALIGDKKVLDRFTYTPGR